MDEANKKFTLNGKEYHEGDAISLDGSTGNIYDGIILQLMLQSLENSEESWDGLINTEQ